MSRLQLRLFGPCFDSFLPHNYGYEPANELKTVLKPPNFRFSPHSPTASWSTHVISYLQKSPRNCELFYPQHLPIAFDRLGFKGKTQLFSF